MLLVSVFFNLNGKENLSLFCQIMTAVLLLEVTKQKLWGYLWEHPLSNTKKNLKEKEIAHPKLSELRVVDDMHARKALMADLADGFIALPGGIGTMEELFEVWTWSNLRIHAKPCVLLNVDGYYDDLLRFLDKMKTAGFIKEQGRSILRTAESVTEAIEALGS